MKIALIAAATLTLAAAPAAQSQVTLGGQPIDRAAEQQCRERIELVRMERGLPRLERDTASPEEPLFFTALHYSIDGCAALVMKGDTSDIRPVPVISGDKPLFQRALNDSAKGH